MLGASGGSWRPLGGLLGPPVPPLGPILGLSWGPLGQSWAPLGPSVPSWAILGASWGPLGPSWGDLGDILGRLGCCEGPKGGCAKHVCFPKDWDDLCFLGVLLRLSWGVLGASWGPLWQSGAGLETLWRARGVVSGRLSFQRARATRLGNPRKIQRIPRHSLGIGGLGL